MQKKSSWIRTRRSRWNPKVQEIRKKVPSSTAVGDLPADIVSAAKVSLRGSLLLPGRVKEVSSSPSAT